MTDPPAPVNCPAARLFLVDIGDPSAALGRGDDAKALELAVKGRPFHADETCRPADVAAKPVDLCQQVFPFEEFARLTQGQSGEAAGQDHPALFARRIIHRRQFPRRDVTIAVAKDQNAFHDVTQLPHVARPDHRLEKRARIICQTAKRKPLRAVQNADEMFGQKRDILAPFLEAGHMDRHHVQAMVEFLPELPRLDQRH